MLPPIQMAFLLWVASTKEFTLVCSLINASFLLFRWLFDYEQHWLGNLRLFVHLSMCSPVLSPIQMGFWLWAASIREFTLACSFIHASFSPFRCNFGYERHRWGNLRLAHSQLSLSHAFHKEEISRILDDKVRKGFAKNNVTKKERKILVFCKTLLFEPQEKLHIKIFCISLSNGLTSKLTRNWDQFVVKKGIKSKRKKFKKSCFKISDFWGTC